MNRSYFSQKIFNEEKKKKEGKGRNKGFNQSKTSQLNVKVSNVEPLRDKIRDDSSHRDLNSTLKQD